MAKELLKRNEVNEEFTWDITALYPDKAAWETTMEEVQEIASRLEKMEGHIADSADTLLSYLTQLEEMEKKLGPAGSYAYLLSDQDVGNTAHQSMLQRVQRIFADIYSKLAFADPEILEIHGKPWSVFMPSSPGWKRTANTSRKSSG